MHPEHPTLTGAHNKLVPILKSSGQLAAEVPGLRKGCKGSTCLCSSVPFGPRFFLLGLMEYSAVSAQGSQSTKAFAGPPMNGRLQAPLLC